MNYTFYIAKRYLLAKKEAGFITVISLISILGVTIGVAALIVVLSVFNGFNGLVTDILVGFDPHIRVQMKRGTDASLQDSLTKYLATKKEIAGISPYVSGKGMLISKKTTKVIFIRGLETKKIRVFPGSTEAWSSAQRTFQTAHPEVVIGYSLADKLGIGIDDTLFVVTSAGVQNALSGIALPQLFSCA
jgi:lipoprotein-releasing system permease protein